MVRPPYASAIRALIDEAQGDDEASMAWAVTTLGHVAIAGPGDPDDTGVDALLAGLHHASSSVRNRSAQALGLVQRGARWPRCAEVAGALLAAIDREQDEPAAIGMVFSLRAYAEAAPEVTVGELQRIAASGSLYAPAAQWVLEERLDWA